MNFASNKSLTAVLFRSEGSKLKYFKFWNLLTTEYFKYLWLKTAVSHIPVLLCVRLMVKGTAKLLLTGLIYFQLSPCGHHANTDAPIIRTSDKSPAKLHYRRSTEIKSRYYGLSLLRTLTLGPE